MARQDKKIKVLKSLLNQRLFNIKIIIMGNEKIEVGDVVSITSESLITDGVRMTVEDITNNIALCVYWDSVNNVYREREFSLSILTLINKRI